jgi:HK97 family phage prohead protease
VAKLETRTNPTHFEIRELEDGGLRFEGYAAVFNSPSEPLPFTERIAPGAFARSIRSRNNIMMLWNHDAGQPLASTRAGTMTLTEDDRGLKVTADLAPTSLGRDISTLVSTRVIDSMSFGFSVVRDSWNRDGTERTLESVRLFEVSLVSFPAYEGTAGTTSVRGLERVAERAAVDADAIADVLLKVEGGQTIDPSEREMMTKVLDELSPQDATVEDGQSDADMLALKKLKLKLLEL